MPVNESDIEIEISSNDKTMSPDWTGNRFSEINSDSDNSGNSLEEIDVNNAIRSEKTGHNSSQTLTTSCEAILKNSVSEIVNKKNCTQ